MNPPIKPIPKTRTKGHGTVDPVRLLDGENQSLTEALRRALADFLKNGGTVSDSVELVLTLSDGCGVVAAGSVDEIRLDQYLT